MKTHAELHTSAPRSLALSSTGLPPCSHDAAFRVVVAVASEGGLAALGRILSDLPAGFDVPLAVVQHRSMRCPELLAILLQRHTALAVKDVADGDEIRPGAVYVAPPGVHLLIGANGRFALRGGEKVKHARPAGDVLFASAAEVFGARVVALVLTGGDGDGSDGARMVRQHGGLVISQSERSARAPGMPRSAIETGCVDYVLSLTEIGAALGVLALRGPLREPASE